MKKISDNFFPKDTRKHYITQSQHRTPGGNAYQERVRVTEVKGDLLTQLFTARVEEVVTLPVHVVVLDVLNATDEAVQLIKLVKGQIYLLCGGQGKKMEGNQSSWNNLNQ